MLRRLGSVFGVVFGLAGLLSGCSGTPVVGVVLPTTGAAASYGESIESGIRLALADSRERNELPTGFEVLWADTGSDPDRAVAEFRRLVEEQDTKMVVGGATSAEAAAMIAEADRLEVVCLSPSASAPGLARQSRYFFRIYPSDELEGHTAANFLHERLGKHAVILFTGDTEYVRGIKPEFLKQYQQALGGDVVADIELAREGWKQNATEVLNTSGVNAAYVVGYAEEILEVIQFLDALGFDGRIVTTSAIYSGQVIREAGTAAENVMFPLPPFDRTSEKEPVLSFVNKYMDTYQRAPDVFAAHGYDAMGLTIQVMNLANPPETMEILKALNFGVTEFMGVTGPILFDDYGDVKHYPMMFIVNGGQVLSYQRFLEAERRRIVNQVQDLLSTGG
ncbi:MAG: penicillin-binding protein activator [Acidobacteriota bacterium]|jgi:branched-chain amino acid transport system substrate-binding protein